MNRESASTILSQLCLSQLCLSQLAQISTVRISRFLGGSLELRVEEMQRLSKVLSACRAMQDRSERVASKSTINWNECVDEIQEKIKADQSSNTDFDFCADIDFYGDTSALLFAVPKPILEALMVGGPKKILQITFEDIANLLLRIVRSPEVNSPEKRKEAEDLLRLAINRSDATEPERELVLSLMQSQENISVVA